MSETIKPIRAIATEVYDPDGYLEFCEDAGLTPTQDGFLEFIQEWLNASFPNHIPDIEILEEED